jgi:hypothetical protein
MQKSIFLTLFLLSFTRLVSAQGTIRGKVSDNLGEALIGVTVVVKGNTTIGSSTDFDGNYSLRLPDDKPVVLLISYIGFRTLEEQVQVTGGGVLVKNFVLQSSAVEVKEVKVEAKAVKAANYYMENMKKQSATSIDYISSETMRKTGDNNVASAVSRVTGVSNTSSGFITVRGIGDRYIRTTVNGSTIPTLDPFTNNIRLDFIPANLVDNIIITKTASPDLPGNWAGAYISVETKDYPEQLTVAAETQIGYNTQSTFRNILSGDRSPTDWLGFDNGLRDRDHSGFIEYTVRPTQFQEMVALGLGSFYASLGITSSWDPNSQQGQDLFKLGLVELGLLAPAQINDPVAFAAAVDTYESNQALQAFETINGPAAAQNKTFANTWQLGTRRAPVNFSQSFGVGNQVSSGKTGTLGYLFGVRYGSNVVYDPASTLGRARTDQNNVLGVPFTADQRISRETNTWSALAKLSYKFNPNHSVSALFMPNLNGSNSVRELSGIGFFEDQPLTQFFSKDQIYEERRQLVYQFASDHYFPGIKGKLETKASYTDGRSNIPDFRSLSLFDADDIIVSGIGNSPNTRDFRYLNEDVIDARLSLEMPISEKPGMSRKMKFGGSYTQLDRDFNQYQYILSATDSNGNAVTGSYEVPNGDLDAFLNTSNFDIQAYTFQGIPRRRANIFYIDTDFPGNRTLGYSKVLAGFAMADYSIDMKWRVTGGLRVEHARIFADIYEYYVKGYAKNDIRRKAEGDNFLSNPGDIDVVKFLPSVSVIYKYIDDDTRSSNIRFNYARSTAYPSIREITENNVLDFELRSIVSGNSELKPVDIDNFDIRWETYLKSGNTISASGFYKRFVNHIELLNFNETNTWTNSGLSYVAGLELEGVRKFSKQLEVRANATFIYSETNVILRSVRSSDGIKEYVPYDTLVRSMFGQAPYVFNTIINYAFEKSKVNLTLSYNVQGPRLVFAATETAPDVYEMPRNQIDLKATRPLGKHFTAALTLRDILNQPVRRKFDLGDGQKLDYDSYRWGTGITLGITYRL